MRVALVTNFTPHYRRPLYVELARRLDLTLVETSAGREWYWEGERPMAPDGISVVQARRAPALRRALRVGDFDAVVSSLTGRATLLTAFTTARRLAIPFVLWVGIWEHPRTIVHRLSRPVARHLFRAADAVLTYGPHVSDYVRRESGRCDRVLVACQAVDNDRFRVNVPVAERRAARARLGVGAEPGFIFVGRLTEEKGLTTLLEASARASEPHRLVLVGRGPLDAELRSYAASLGLTGRIRLVGSVDYDELPLLLQASDALVLPSRSTRRVKETWGLVANEAMNCGLPVIATTAVGAAAGGLVVDGETGLVVPERDPDALARAIDELASDEARRHQLGARAREHVLAWSYGAAADAFEAALDAAVVGRLACAS